MFDRQNSQIDMNTIINDTDKHCMHTANRYPLCIEKGNGTKLYDIHGNVYTDFLAGIAVNAFGYHHPHITAAVQDQISKCLHVSNLFYNKQQTQFAKRLTEYSGFSRVFLCNSGAEANEGALKLARKYFYDLGKPRSKTVSAINSFHGRTLATAAITGQTKYSAPYKPLPDGMIHIPFNELNGIDEAIDTNTAAVFIECIQGEGGLLPATPEYMQAIYQRCQETGTLLVIDEIQTGMGRTGTLYAYEQFPNIHPDIITSAKALGGGLPLGAVLCNEKLACVFQPGDHGSTFGGNVVACAAGNAVLDLLYQDNCMEQIQITGEKFQKKLTALLQYSFVEAVQGMGLMLGLRLNSTVKASHIVEIMQEKGYIINAVGNNTLRFTPPLIITLSEIESLVSTLNELFLAISIAKE